MACAGLCLLAGSPLPGRPGTSHSRLLRPTRRALSAGGHPRCGPLPLAAPPLGAPPLPRPARNPGRRWPRLPKASAEDFTEHTQGNGAAAAPEVVSPQSGVGRSGLASGGLIRSAGLVGAATVASKILGLLREVVIASVFGVGPVATAFNHAVVLPRFCSSFLGGVNGPVHIAVATTLSKLPKDRRRQLIQKTHTLAFLVGGVVGLITFLFAESIIHMSAPGLWALAEGQLIREISATQLKLMTPCILFSGLNVLGFGCLSAEGDNIIPSLSPSITSIAIIISCILFITMNGSNTSSLGSALSGGIFLSCGASMGSLLQWIIQVIMHEKTGYGSASLTWEDIFVDHDVHVLFSLILPSILSSGLVQIASLTDLYFASFIPGAAAGLSYAHLMVMAPLGILSSTIVLPLLPVISRLAKASSWTSLKENLQEGILLCLMMALPITSSICMLAGPVIRVVFQRLTFDSAASSFVSSLLLCYSVGSPFFIIRELLVVVFYALEIGHELLLVNIGAILLNALLDWLSVSTFGLGGQGLALSTSCVTAMSVLTLSSLLSKKLSGIIDLKELSGSVCLLLACCTFSCFITWAAHRTLPHAFPIISFLRLGRLRELVAIMLAGILGLCGFYIPLEVLRFPALKTAKELLRRFTKRCD